ncbi:hypothetical protein [Natrinema salaciae]|uniref:Uncharacterized protein n=1 Tax=Natrinema salaciae TaxID=1186196 RepID=A0A1H8ZBY3_9EURY|nr:hypothetical protein [Natrinema salaciae]SEP61881.1 hypothetical protein SAMN04489841_0124 [Natrinema salaciae]
MSAESNSEIVDQERRLAKTTAISLGMWLALTMAAVVLLLLFGDAISSLVV